MHRQSMISAPSEKSRTEIPPGTLEMLILKTLKRFGPKHGHGIAKSILALIGVRLKAETAVHDFAAP
jgi:hypothetical protein